MKDMLKPDRFAIGLAALGAILVFVPMAVMPGVIAILLAAAYWFTMTLAQVVHRRRRRM